MNTATHRPATTSDFPPPPACVFLIGLGGIGMSALAQYLHARGYEVAGSDRQLEGPGRSELMAKLRAMGIRIYPQDGSGPKHASPVALIASAAVEEGNPDFLAAPALPRFARAEALARLVNREGALQIAIAGSAGKTTVTGWLSAALTALGKRVLTVNGGYMIDTESDRLPGNFRDAPNPDVVVVEVDESDKSLLAFSPHIGVVLNIGTDHYSTDELAAVFARFLAGCRRGTVLPLSLRERLGACGPAIRLLFADSLDYEGDTRVMTPCSFRAREDGCSFVLRGIGTVRCGQFGHHSAINAAAVTAALAATGLSFPPAALCQALGAFRGIRQRFEFMGLTSREQAIYHDYAHNVQKIAAAITTARQTVHGPLLVIFQPHGFGPLGFMREGLRDMLETVLRKTDRFVFLPVYYSGGTTSFTPTAKEVAEEYARAGLPVSALDQRDALPDLVADSPAARAVLVLGARDPSLPSLAQSLRATYPE